MAMDAVVRSFHRSLSSDSDLSLARFNPVMVLLYNEKFALFRSLSILSIHHCFEHQTGRYFVGSSYKKQFSSSKFSVYSSYIYRPVPYAQQHKYIQIVEKKV